MGTSSRKYTQRKEMRGYYHLRTVSGSCNPRLQPIAGELSAVFPISTAFPGVCRQPDSEKLSIFDPQLVSCSSDSNINTQSISPKAQASQAKSSVPRKKRTKYFTERGRLEHDVKRGEKWTEEEEALLRQRRNGEPESWEETGKYFTGRTTNALQKKWKLMTLSDKMKIEPELENQLMVAIAKHAPTFYRQLALEMKMSDDEVGIIVDKISILFMQGKLPLRSNSPNVTACEDVATSILQKPHPPSVPSSRDHSTGTCGRPLGGSELQATHSYMSYQPSDRNFEFESPKPYSSDTEDSLQYQLDDNNNGVSENNLISFYWNEDYNLTSSYFMGKTYSDYNCFQEAESQKLGHNYFSR